MDNLDKIGEQAAASDPATETLQKISRVKAAAAAARAKVKPVKINPQIDLDKIGERAAAGLKALDVQGDAARTDLQQVWKAFDDAKKNKVEIVINGAKSKTEWAKWSGQTMRNIQYVLRGKRDRTKEIKKRTSGSRVVNLDNATYVTYGGNKFKVTSMMQHHGTININIEHVSAVGEKAAKKPVAPVVTHIRASSRRTLCEKRFVNRPLLKNKVFKKDGEEATCPDCVRFAAGETKSFSQIVKEYHAKKTQPVESPVLSDSEMHPAAEALAATVENTPTNPNLEAARKFRESPSNIALQECGNLDGDDETEESN